MAVSVDVDAIKTLKQKVCDEFYSLLCEARRGYLVDYEYILDEITFIELLEHDDIEYPLSLSLFQYYLNNRWQAVRS